MCKMTRKTGGGSFIKKNLRPPCACTLFPLATDSVVILWSATTFTTSTSPTSSSTTTTTTTTSSRFVCSDLCILNNVGVVRKIAPVCNNKLIHKYISRFNQRKMMGEKRTLTSFPLRTVFPEPKICKLFVCCRLFCRLRLRLPWSARGGERTSAMSSNLQTWKDPQRECFLKPK